MATNSIAGFPAARTHSRIGYRALGTTVALVVVWIAAIVASIVVAGGPAE